MINWNETMDINRYQFEHVTYVTMKHQHLKILEQWLYKNVGAVHFDWSYELERMYARTTAFSFRKPKHNKVFALLARFTGCVVFDTFNEYTTWCENV